MGHSEPLGNREKTSRGEGEAEEEEEEDLWEEVLAFFGIL